MRFHRHLLFKSTLVNGSCLYQSALEIHGVHLRMRQPPDAFWVRHQSSREHGVQYLAALPCKLRIEFKFAVILLADDFHGCSLIGAR